MLCSFACHYHNQKLLFMCLSWYVLLTIHIEKMMLSLCWFYRCFCCCCCCRCFCYWLVNKKFVQILTYMTEKPSTKAHHTSLFTWIKQYVFVQDWNFHHAKRIIRNSLDLFRLNGSLHECVRGSGYTRYTVHGTLYIERRGESCFSFRLVRFVFSPLLKQWTTVKNSHRVVLEEKFKLWFRVFYFKASMWVDFE